jgi:branched-subunit amino acid transport protein
MNDWSVSATSFWAIVGMTVMTVLTRSLFFLSSKPWTLPRWAQRGLPYAPIAALAAVVVPEVLLTQGQLILTGTDARWYGALAGMVWFYFTRRSPNAVLGTIVVGMTVYLPLHIGLGW